MGGCTRTRVTNGLVSLCTSFAFSKPSSKLEKNTYVSQSARRIAALLGMDFYPVIASSSIVLPQLDTNSQTWRCETSQEIIFIEGGAFYNSNYST
jgi:hypothetical protein